MSMNDTIAAIATGSAISAIGIVRVSGDKALTAADNIFRIAGGTPLSKAQDKRMYYGRLTGTDGRLIDLCLCTFSRAPGTYTGEDTAEFHCHGSPVVLAQVLEALFAQGVRQAGAGEFTKRAFLNGRMDLTQAEAVIDLIEAETPLAATNAAEQLRGAVCGKMDEIYNKLIGIMAHFHAVIDYPDEDIGEFELQNYRVTLSGCAAGLRRLLDTQSRGKMLRLGIPAAIVGRTNTGKSSLFNALLGYNRAIVTDIHGTTRDTIEEKILIGSLLLRLTDTAGLRSTGDSVEKLGVGRSLTALGEAELILAVFDGSQPFQEDDSKVLSAITENAPGVPVIAVINKSDLPGALTAGMTVPTVTVSALTGEGIDELCRQIEAMFPGFDTPPDGGIITSARQAEAIGRALKSLELAEKALAAEVTPDAVLTDIEAALGAIGEVTGKTMREDIISQIFGRFCVGK